MAESKSLGNVLLSDKTEEIKNVLRNYETQFHKSMDNIEESIQNKRRILVEER